MQLPLSVVLSLCTLGCAAGSSAPQQPVGTTATAVGPDAPSLQPPPDTTVALALSRTFRWAAERTLPSVVFVSVEGAAANTTSRMPLPEAFRQFFNLPDDALPLPPEQSAGTGFVFDQQGHIITARHVVAQGERITVRFRDGREFPATIAGADPVTDIAVLTIDGTTGYAPAILGNSDSTAVGDWVLALGNPLGLDFSVTAGIVSAKGRQLTGLATALESFIQTDAAINPGNSGGPLVDVRGRVIGINTAITGGTRFVGYGFAVPVNLARRVVSDLLAYGRVRRPRLGVRVSDVTAVDAEVYGLDRVFGADVAGIEPGSPAARAGLRIGDVIIAVDGVPVRDANALTTGLAARQPGDRVNLTLIRDRQRQMVPVTLGEFTDGRDSTRAARPVDRAPSRLDFTVQPLTPALAAELGLTARAGVVVTDVMPWSTAARAGLRAGQLVLHINRQPVATVDDVARIGAGLRPGTPVSVRVIDRELGETLINYRLRR